MYKVLQIGYHFINNFFYGWQVIFHYIKNNFRINVKIMVSNNISHPHYTFSIYL